MYECSNAPRGKFNKHSAAVLVKTWGEEEEEGESRNVQTTSHIEGVSFTNQLPSREMHTLYQIVHLYTLYQNVL